MSIRKVLCIVIAAIAFAGCCKTSAGSSCLDEGTAECDGARMLMCKSHKWEVVSCAGPKGCSQSGRFVDCDETVATVGMPCSVEPDSYSSCSTDHKTQLKCDVGFWREDIPCRGPKGCVVSKRFVDCDDSLALVGDACEPDGLACSVDSKSVLTCRGGKYALDETCSPGRCTIRGTTVGCE